MSDTSSSKDDTSSLSQKCQVIQQTLASCQEVGPEAHCVTVKNFVTSEPLILSAGATDAEGKSMTCVEIPEGVSESIISSVTGLCWKATGKKTGRVYADNFCVHAPTSWMILPNPYRLTRYECRQLPWALLFFAFLLLWIILFVVRMVYNRQASRRECLLKQKQVQLADVIAGGEGEEPLTSATEEFKLAQETCASKEKRPPGINKKNVGWGWLVVVGLITLAIFVLWMVSIGNIGPFNKVTCEQCSQRAPEGQWYWTAAPPGSFSPSSLQTWACRHLGWCYCRNPTLENRCGAHDILFPPGDPDRPEETKRKWIWNSEIANSAKDYNCACSDQKNSQVRVNCGIVDANGLCVPCDLPSSISLTKLTPAKPKDKDKET